MCALERRANAEDQPDRGGDEQAGHRPARACFGARSRTTSTTGRRRTYSVPKSPCRTPPSQRTYWTGNGSSRPSSWRICCAIWVPAALIPASAEPSIASDRIARHQVQHAEDDQRGHQQYRHRFDQAPQNERNHRLFRAQPTPLIGCECDRSCVKVRHTARHGQGGFVVQIPGQGAISFSHGRPKVMWYSPVVRSTMLEAIVSVRSSSCRFGSAWLQTESGCPKWSRRPLAMTARRARGCARRSPLERALDFAARRDTASPAKTVDTTWPARRAQTP